MVGSRSRSRCVDIRRIGLLLGAKAPSEDEVDKVEIVAFRSISLVALRRGISSNRPGEASRSFLCISTSATFILAVLSK